MAKDREPIEFRSTLTIETVRQMLKLQRIASAAVHKAQEENRRLGIPNSYSVNGKIVSDIQLAKEGSNKSK